MGGWITIVQYCRSGFRPCPSPRFTMLPFPAWNTWNGLITKVIRIRKNAAVVIRTTVTHGIISRNFFRLVNTTTAEYVESRKVQNSSEPSWPPHHDANL